DRRVSTTISTAAGLLLVGAATAANAWTTSGDITAPNGATYHYMSCGSCANGRCRSQLTVTGPAGGTHTREGTTTCVNGTWPSRPREFHPEPLTEPLINLSIFTARATVRRLPPSVRMLRSSCCQLSRS